MFEKRLNKKYRQFLYEYIKKQVSSELFFLLKSKEYKDKLIEDIYKQIIDIFESRIGCLIEVNKNTLTEEVNSLLTKKILSENLDIKEYHIDVCKSLISIYPGDETQRLDIKEINMQLFKKFNLYFEKCNFGCEIEMIFSHIQKYKKVGFKNCTFKKQVNFSNSIFVNNVYFNNSIFEDYADFHECEFEKVACFYGVEFKKVPNFSQAKFIGNLDPVNMKMDFNMSGIKKSIKKAKEISENKNNNNNEKEDYKFANDFRDSFRVFKSALIKDNNLLEASRFHKYELYARELELKHKGKKTLKDKIDYWQIVFYRKLCEHHTDLLLNLKWLVIAIGLFASLYFISRSIQDIGILEFLNTFGACFSIACAFIMLVLCCFGCKSRHKRLNVFASIGTVITLLAIYYKPQLIFGIANLFGDTKYNGLENFLITIYTIVIGLIIFSLQKTARKNSIVPN